MTTNNNECPQSPDFFGIKLDTIKTAYGLMDKGLLGEMTIPNTTDPSPGRLGAKLVLMGSKALTLIPIDCWEDGAPVFKLDTVEVHMSRDYLEV